MADSTRWFYLDHGGSTQGPFTSAHMRSWYDGGYFPHHTKVASRAAETPESSETPSAPPEKRSFRPIAALWARPKEQGFTAPPQHSGWAKRKFGDGAIEFHISDDETELRHKKPKKSLPPPRASAAALIGPAPRPGHGSRMYAASVSRQVR